METPKYGTFGPVLRGWRRARGLTQEVLAERAQLSREAISALERGQRRTPHGSTVGLLVEALGLTGAERVAFEAAAARAVSVPWPPALGSGRPRPNLPVPATPRHRQVCVSPATRRHNDTRFCDMPFCMLTCSMVAVRPVLEAT